MSEKNMQEREKRNKVINIVLCAGVIASVAYNVYQFNSNSILKNEIDSMEADIESLETENTKLDKDIEASKNTLLSLSTQIEELNTTVESLEADNKSLSDSLEELNENEHQGDELLKSNPALSEVELTEEDLKNVDKMVEDMMKEHPEWFSNTSGGGGTTNEGNYESVGTPDNVELPNTGKFGSTTSDVPPGTVY